RGGDHLRGGRLPFPAGMAHLDPSPVATRIGRRGGPPRRHRRAAVPSRVPPPDPRPVAPVGGGRRHLVGDASPGPGGGTEAPGRIDDLAVLWVGNDAADVVSDPQNRSSRHSLAGWGSFS